MALLDLTPDKLSQLSDQELLTLAQQVNQLQQQDRQLNQLRYYQPASQRALEVHKSTCKTIGIGGGNGSSKTETALVELLIRATGQIPLSLRDVYPRSKIRGPINTRVVCESLTTTLYPIILPKLQYTRWNGVSRAGGDKGHWGWIPKHCLISGDWSKSWNDKHRLLRLYHRDTDNPTKILGESTIQFMSYDQDPSDFASGDFQFILHDEPPKEAIWNENLARVMRVDGTIMVAMTWPDDPAIAVDWLYELYEKAQSGDPSIHWVNLVTTENPNLLQDAVAERAKQMNLTVRMARIYGQPIRMSNRVHPLFTDQESHWCFDCLEQTILRSDGSCGNCMGTSVTRFTHVQSAEVRSNYPVIYALDPHPRKPHMMAWYQIDPNDDLYQVTEATIDGVPEDVANKVHDIEQAYGWHCVTRIMDPNMGASPSSTDRITTWQDAFDRAGLRCDLADDSDVGCKELDLYLRPDPNLLRPRFIVDPGCLQTIYQFKRYIWDDYKRHMERDQKQTKRAKFDDFPTLAKYVMNLQPSFQSLRLGGQVFRREGRSERGY